MSMEYYNSIAKKKKKEINKGNKLIFMNKK